MKRFFLILGETDTTLENSKKWDSKWYGLETALYHASQLWSLVPVDLTSLPNVNLFKSKIKHWECTECPCKHCKTYLKNIGYV